ncbi:hypothetical protein ACFPN1_09180 [Lysobacter yangpyeongensis]|uniref:Uncharacterized protein n=1 Tax=Lysobacter yangpyeongensis TaxID=346182 RepID=A0ABW0SNA7_9GAMM
MEQDLRAWESAECSALDAGVVAGAIVAGMGRYYRRNTRRRGTAPQGRPHGRDRVPHSGEPPDSVQPPQPLANRRSDPS